MAYVNKFKRSATPGKVPTTSDLELGEVSINTYDGRMYMRINNGVDAIVEITGSGITGNPAWGLITGSIGAQTDLQTALSTKQPLDGDLTAIGALTGTFGLLKKTAANTWELDATGYASATHVHTGVYEPANANIQSHISSTSNPHNVTKAQIGLDNVNNTSDINKPVSIASQTALDLKSNIGHTHTGVYEPANANIQTHISDTNNPHSVTANQVLPTQTGNSGKVLGTDGATVSWVVMSGGGGDIYQPVDGDLTAIAALSGTSGLLKKTAANIWTLDTNAYTTNTGTVTSVAAITLGTTGTDLNSSVATGTTTPVITLNIPTASASNRGALSAADWTTFNNKQPAGSYLTSAVTSVSGNGTVSGLTLSGSVTTTGSLTLGGTLAVTPSNFTSQTQKTFLAAPNAINGTPSFRTIVSSDIPTLNQNTTGSAGSTAASITFNNSGIGDASGSTFNGSLSRTISYNSIGASPLAGSVSLTTTGTVTTGTWSGLFGAVSGANLTTLNASNLSSGTVGTARLGTGTADSTTYLRGDGTWATPTGGGGGGGSGVTSVAMTVPTGLTVTGSPITSVGTLALTMTAGYAIPTTASQTNWNTAYTDRNKWDGGSTGLTASTGRTSLGANTVGSNLFTLSNPSAITFLRINADNTVSTLNAADFRTAIGAGTSSTTGTVTSVAAITLGTTGTDLSSSIVNGTTTPVITLNVPTASASNRGALSAADWTTFNNKQPAGSYLTSAVTSVAMTVPTGLTVTGSPITSTGTLALAMTAGYAIPTTASQTNWNTAYTDRNKWDGGSTGLTASTGRTSLGGTTVGSNFFTLTNPTAITFPRINADNTVSTLNAADFRTAIGAGTSSTTGTVTSVAALTLGTTGTDLNSSVATGTTTPVITLNIPTASAANRGALSAADWTTFNNKTSNTGTVTTASVVTANGFAGTVATATSTPAITVSTTVTGLVKGNGTALSAATAGTDYLAFSGLSKITVGTTAPSSPAVGDLWFDTN